MISRRYAHSVAMVRALSERTFMVLKYHELTLFLSERHCYKDHSEASMSIMQARSEQFGSLAQFLPLLQPKHIHLFEAPHHSLESAVYNVAILEGNIPLARLMATGLSTESLRIHIHEDLDSAKQLVETQGSDLLILDLDLEGVDGLELLAKLRTMQPSMRILVLSGRASVERAVEALNRGADDYLMKPFSLLEMMARVRALRRRSGEVMQGPQPSSGRLILNKNQSRVTCHGQVIDLTPRECELLDFMMAHPGTTLSRATLSQQVWNMPAEANTNIVDVYMKYLRDKLEHACQQKLIRTVRGVGYVFQYQS